ncbi:type VI secretion system lipoprotein TssJ [Mangrovitalea sediminis]|uniref:type VI secretion system lipoprotein TssJ n=1 Tax=Mangrovitalea sediminis TaxID=1982043 RepID=UPI000BE5AD9B|nr:type VI secretion system lipoprotein TssJ [Mangrovitalea sediminis]
MLSAPRRLFRWLALSAILAAAGLGGCSTVREVYPPYTELDIKASADTNPNIQGQASPVVVRVYELGAKDVFQNSGFFPLFSQDKSVLGPDLLKKSEFELRPTETKVIHRELNPATRYLGIVVAYRDIGNANWRAVIPVDPDGHDTFSVDVNRLSLAIGRDH